MKLHKSQTASMPALEYLPAAAETEYKVGMGLTLGETAAKVAATAVPEYICMANSKGEATVPAIRVLAGETYEAPLAVDGSALKVGNKVTIDSDGIRVTATTASGVAKIVGFATELKAAGDGVFIKF
jgi:hypothetical protein